MAADQSYIDALARNPRESLTAEVKTWIDPRTPEGAAKLVRACIALRNAGGGFLLIGFNNDTGQPDGSVPATIDEQFHIDMIQGLVTKHSSEPFAIDVRWAELASTRHPVIEVPPGVKSPVAAKSPIDDADGKRLVHEHAVYMRSLQSNNTPATTQATYRDWSSIVDICFENREADIGRFLRRHLRGVTPEVIRELTMTLQKAQTPTQAEQALQTLEDGGSRFRTRLAASNPELSPLGINEVAFVIPLMDPSPVKLNTAFLNLLMSANPKYTGWPMFLDSRGSHDAKKRPEVIDGAWQALVLSLGGGFGLSDEADFWRASPSGSFYHGRILQDDMSHSVGGPLPSTAIDFGLAILRCAEAVLLGLDFASALNAPENASVIYAFRWSKLKGRELTSWAQQRRRASPGRKSFQDEVLSEIAVPVGTPKTAAHEYVHAALVSLFDAFDGTAFDVDLTASLVENLITQRTLRPSY